MIEFIDSSYYLNYRTALSHVCVHMYADTGIHMYARIINS